MSWGSTTGVLNVGQKADSRIPILLNEVVADEVKKQVEWVMAGILEPFGEPAEQVFPARTLNERGGVCTIVWIVVEHVLPVHIQAALIRQAIENQADKSFEAGKST